jgi:hypothetical protein
MASKWKVESETRSGLIHYQNDADPNQCLHVYMMWDVMILMGENPFRGPLDVVGPENPDFWAQNWQRANCLFLT